MDILVFFKLLLVVVISFCKTAKVYFCYSVV